MPRRSAAHDPALPIIARNLKAVRDDLKLKQQDVERRAGTPKGQLSRWEKARKKPEIDSLLRLAVAYECSVEDFVAGVNEDYDKLTERGIGANVRRHYQARYAELKDLATKAVAAITSVVETSPTSGALSGTVPTARGKSKQARARRVPVKK